jgi:hypothetical protein
MPFCTNCGKPYKENSRFCQSCGMPLVTVAAGNIPTPAAGVPPAPLPPPPLMPASTSIEPVRFVISNLSLPKSWGRSDNYTLILTDRRSIFAKVTQEIMNETVKLARADAEAQGKGFFGKWAAQMKGFNNYAARYNSLTPDQILQETQGNFAIDNSSIRVIKIRDESDDEDSRTIYGIEYQMINGKLKFKSMYDLEKQFKQAYGPGLVK